jgi:hypothetical protein
MAAGPRRISNPDVVTRSISPLLESVWPVSPPTNVVVESGVNFCRREPRQPGTKELCLLGWTEPGSGKVVDGLMFQFEKSREGESMIDARPARAGYDRWTRPRFAVHEESLA